MSSGNELGIKKEVFLSKVSFTYNTC